MQSLVVGDRCLVRQEPTVIKHRTVVLHRRLRLYLDALTALGRSALASSSFFLDREETHVPNTLSSVSSAKTRPFLGTNYVHRASQRITGDLRVALGQLEL
jgi:hypothetical protein